MGFLLAFAATGFGLAVRGVLMGLAHFGLISGDLVTAGTFVAAGLALIRVAVAAIVSGELEMRRDEKSA